MGVFMSQEIRIRVEGGVLTITLNRIERKNAITAVMYRAVTDALAGAAVDRVVRAVVLGFARMLAEPAAKETISAFLAKRKPDFSML